MCEEWNIKSEEELKSYAEDANDIELETAIRIYNRYGLESIESAHKIAKQYFTSSEKQRISLTTAHSSKGLEWDVVIVENDFSDLALVIANFIIEESLDKIDSEFDFLNYFTTHLKDVNNEDINEINLLYVAFTRAKKSIDIRTDNIEYLDMNKDDFNKNIFKSYSAILSSINK